MSRRRRRRLTPEGRKGVDVYGAGELHRFLVADAVAKHATYLPWAVAAYDRIAKLERITAEDAYQRVLDEVEMLTGLRMMPVESPTKAAELRRLGL